MSKLEQRTCLPRASRIGGTVRSGWSHDCSDTSTARYIIYNIEIWGCLKARNIQRKPTLLNVPWRFLFPPPPRREKKHPQPTQNAFPLRLPHHQCAAPEADSLSSPHLRMNCADLAEDSCPGRISDYVLAPSRTRISSPPAIAQAQRPSISHTKCNPTCACAMGQDYPLTRPSPGANRPIYPSFPALASRSLPEGRIPKSHVSFFFLSLAQGLCVCERVSQLISDGAYSSFSSESIPR